MTATPENKLSLGRARQQAQSLSASEDSHLLMGAWLGASVNSRDLFLYKSETYAVNVVATRPPHFNLTDIEPLNFGEFSW
jgi:hypothetical protein